MPPLEAALVPRRRPAERALLARDANLNGFVRSSGPQDSKADRSVQFILPCDHASSRWPSKLEALCCGTFGHLVANCWYAERQVRHKLLPGGLISPPIIYIRQRRVLHVHGPGWARSLINEFDEPGDAKIDVSKGDVVAAMCLYL